MKRCRHWLTLLLVGSSFVTLSAEAQETNGKAPFFLPKNPIAAAYILSRFSNQELIQAPRSEFVYVALLQRPGLEPKYRTEALEELSRIHKSDALTELLATFVALDKKGEGSAQILTELSSFLLRAPTNDLLTNSAKLQELAFKSQLPVTRQIGMAAIVTADHSIEPLWPKATNELRADLLSGLPLVPDSDLRSACYSNVAPLLHDAPTSQIRRAAIAAVVAVPGHDSEKFNALVDLFQAGIDRATVIAGLSRIPQAAWPKGGLEALAHMLLDYLQSIPTNERTDESFTRALQFGSEVVSLLPREKSTDLTRVLRGLGPSIFVIRPVYEQMRFDRQLIVVEVGRPVAIILENQDAMPHNLAIVMPGALEEIGLLSEKMPAEPDAQGRLYVPASSKVLQATRLVAPGQKTELAFTAPSEPGDYPYVCTFPGHWRRMVGVMAVVKDVEAYLANDAAARQTKITEWKLEDLAPELSKVGIGRNLSAGQELFTQLACVQCHKLGLQGYAYGPDLTDVFTKYKNDHANLLLQILEPSRIIEDRYRTFEFEIKDGEPVTGMILNEAAENVTVQSGASASLIQTLKKAQIQNRRALASSPMPTGLLNTLSKEQILDLLAYVESAGKPPAHDHAGVAH